MHDTGAAAPIPISEQGIARGLLEDILSVGSRSRWRVLCTCNRRHGGPGVAGASGTLLEEATWY